MNRSQKQWTRRDWLRNGAATGIGSLAISAKASEPKSPPPISVLSFNILAGGRRGLEACARLILESGADICGLQEVNPSGAKLEELTGFHRFERGGKQILSRYPIGDATPKRRGVKIDIPDTDGVWFFNDHLRPAPYQPYQLAEIPYGKNNPFITTEEEAISEATRARGDEIDVLLKDMEAALASGLPVILTGDFNEPSHLDWTAKAAETKCCKLPVKWPASTRISNAGLDDMYRKVFPDEINRPGHTWTPTPAKRDVPDRIDIIYAKGLEPESAAVIGESKEKADIVVDPFPSDHRAVFVKLILPPARQ
ncbi:MAG: exodeoxyribonuclease-3 [Pseudoalteromonas tetraodonis]|jgi:exodeoxyribonuclease-3